MRLTRYLLLPPQDIFKRRGLRRGTSFTGLYIRGILEWLPLVLFVVPRFLDITILPRPWVNYVWNVLGSYQLTPQIALGIYSLYVMFIGVMAFKERLFPRRRSSRFF